MSTEERQPASSDRSLQDTGLTGKRLLLLSLVAGCSLPGTFAGDCVKLVRSIDYRQQPAGPYNEERAVKDFAPVVYLDGFYGDSSTKGTTQKRAYVVSDGNNNVLEVLLPEGCVTSACGMQCKSVFDRLESATFVMKFKFNAGFDWVRGGKLPGLCGGTCPTGCKQVSGYDGFSARHMWRPCVWPPEHETKALQCTGGKLTSYVYHTEKEHWCGDDFDFENDLWMRAYNTDYYGEVTRSFLSPETGAYYTIYSHVEMNTPGVNNGVLQTWLEGPNINGAVIVNEKRDMLWRRDDSFGIDTLYFSLFFGGSSESFQAAKDEKILFESLKIYDGDCTPGGSGSVPSTVAPATILKNPLDGVLDNSFKNSQLQSAVLIGNTYTGGCCAKIQVTNKHDRVCVAFEVYLGVHPDYGTLKVEETTGEYSFSGMSLVQENVANGWWKFFVSSYPGNVLVGETQAKSGFCFTSSSSAYTPDKSYYEDRLEVAAKCVEFSDDQSAPANEPAPPAPPNAPPSPDAPPAPPASPGDVTAQYPMKAVFTSVDVWSSKTCVHMGITNTQARDCHHTQVKLTLDMSMFKFGGELFNAWNFDVEKTDASSGLLQMREPVYGTEVEMGRRLLPAGETHNGFVCVEYAEGFSHNSLSVDEAERGFKVTVPVAMCLES